MFKSLQTIISDAIEKAERSNPVTPATTSNAIFENLDKNNTIIDSNSITNGTFVWGFSTWGVDKIVNAWFPEDYLGEE